MANNPNDNDPKPVPNPADQPPLEEENLDELTELDLNNIQFEVLPDPLVGVPGFEDQTVTFDAEPPVADPGSFTIAEALEDVTEALPLSDVNNLGGIAPVSPASGWLDMELPQDLTEVDSGGLGEPIDVPGADIGHGHQGVESSDIFAGGPVARASAANESDVIAATAYEEAAPVDPAKPARLSEVALTFDPPPGGSTIDDIGSGSDLPVADEVFDPDATSELGNIFDSTKYPVTQPPEASDAPDFGATPSLTPDASSILADLGGEREVRIFDSSAVSLEAPGVGRTHSSAPPEGTEFDLTIGQEDELPPELTEVESSDSGHSTDWREQAGSDLFNEGRTTPDFDLDPDAGRVQPVNPALKADDPSLTSAPSSIFSDKKKQAAGNSGKSDVGEVQIGATPPRGEGDSAVEFSDHPSAEAEEAASRIFGPISPPKMPATPAARKGASSADFELPDDAAQTSPSGAGLIDWAAAPSDPDNATIGIARADLGASLSDILGSGGRTPDDSSASTPPMKGKLSAKASESDPSVEIDWMSGSSSEEPVLTDDAVAEAAEAAEAAPTSALDEVDLDAPTRESSKVRNKGKGKPAPEPAPAPAKKTKPTPSRAEVERPAREPARDATGSKKGGWIGGTVLGMVLAGGGFAGVYLGGVIPNGDDSAQKQPAKPGGTGGTGGGTTQPPPAPAATPADIASAIRSGDPARAQKMIEEMKDATPAGKALAGEAALFALVQEKGTTLAADSAELKAARANLKALVDDAEAAKTPEGERAAVVAATRLGLSHELANDLNGARRVYQQAKEKFPKFTATFDAALDRLEATTPAAAPAPVPDGSSRRPTPAEVEQLLFTITLLQDAKATDDEPEAGVFFWKAVKLAGTGNHADAITEMKKAKAAHQKQAKARAGAGLNPLSDPLEQIFPRCCDDLKTYWELRGAIYANKSVAELIEKGGAEKAIAELASAQKKAADAVKVMAELKDVTDKLTKATTDLKKAEADTKLALAEVEKIDKTAKAAVKAATDLETKLGLEEKARKDAEAARQASAEFTVALAKELQTAKLLPEKFTDADVLAAQKRAMERATGPNLSTLVPPAMMAVGGGLSSAQLVDIADRLGKAEAASKVAIDKLAFETKRLTTERSEAEKKLKDDFAADLKKLTDTHATDTQKLKDDQAAKLKEMADKFVADSKKLADGYDGKIKELDAAVAKERDRAEAQAAQFKRDLGNAVSPTQALDLWLPLLVELRRPADAEPALVTATKVLGSAAADTEDGAKARAVAGLALLNKGDLAGAKLQLQAAKTSSAYPAAIKAKKPWAEATDMGIAALTDPLAPYRQPVESQRRDAVAAARLLDAGVKAYKDGRAADAVAALTDSTKADPTNPVAWYFLGAAKWDAGSLDAAKDDFRQGGVREAASALPTRTVSAAIAPIQGPARDALSGSRP